jgi:AraC family transcriptional regulator of arabinose operon
VRIFARPVSKRGFANQAPGVETGTWFDAGLKPVLREMRNPSKRITPGPPTSTLLTGENAGLGHPYLAYRPQGTRDWLAVYTIGGRGRFTIDDVDTPLLPGDLFVIRPGTGHDYGNEPTLRRWHNVWSHFIPRGDALGWLDWPQITPGVMLLHVRADLQSAVLKHFREMDRTARQTIGRWQELGFNALERALLIADGCNPTSAGSRLDPRVRKAMDYLMNNLADPPSLAALADVSGLSRSRLALLFERQVGQPPGKFVERHRLERAKRLLEYTRYSLQQIADELGFSSPFYLSLRFKRWFGVSPRTYRDNTTPEPIAGTQRVPASGEGSPVVKTGTR